MHEDSQKTGRNGASGPLIGLKVLEFAGIGPGPFCGQLLSDAGADVVRIDRTTAADANPCEVTKRGRKSLALNLKDPNAVELCLELIEKADLLFEGFRPGVMERLGLGPKVAHARNPKLVYGRMTGWGQDGPLSHAAGHDINYIAITGALHAIGTKDRPIPPLNLVGDFGGGALYLAFGLLAAHRNALRTGKGQVVDVAMSDGAASLMSFFYGLRADGQLSDSRADNRLDGGAHFYNTYECSDGKWIAIGSFEAQFYEILLDKTGLKEYPDFAHQLDKTLWPKLSAKLEEIFLEKTRDEWCAVFEGSDACFAPVLDMVEAPNHAHNLSRGTFIEVDGVVQPAPAPKFLDTPGKIQFSSVAAGAHNETALEDWGVPQSRIDTLITGGVI